MKLLILSEKEYEILTKGLSIGIFIGIISGAILNNVPLFFALGGVVGIISSGIYISIRKIKEYTGNNKI